MVTEEAHDSKIKNPDDDLETSPACVSCRKRKRRCSRGRPCTLCEKNSIVCEYPVVDEPMTLFNTAQHKSATVSQRLAMLESVCRRHDGILRELVPGYGEDEIPEKEDPEPPLKRRRRDDDNDDDSSLLPNDSLMYKMIDCYFSIIHPWIPMLHERTFTASVNQPVRRKGTINILHGIVAATARFVDDQKLECCADLAKKCRDRVILHSMEQYSVENLQALIIIAFDLIAAGKGPKSWSIVDSMTQVVEHLQLSFEPDTKTSSSDAALIQRVSFLKPAETWLEGEIRRRTFWCVFFLDRFCSVSAGWKPSLSSTNILRRLPCGGTFFTKEVPVQTRMFLNDDQEYDNDSEEIASLGGLAYCVEATESLSQVATFYLEYEINVTQTAALQQWIAKFRRLDARLASWKNNMPREWQHITPRAVHHSKTPIFDENLTLAHVTHNASVVLLHQFLAYPPPSTEWPLLMRANRSRAASATACIRASREISHMTTRYLAVNHDGITNPQYAFCLFVSSRALLAHSVYHQAPVLPEFHCMLKSLNELAVRWRGNGQEDSSNLASKFAKGLMDSLQQIESAAALGAASAAAAKSPTTNSKHAAETKLESSAVDIRKSAYTEDAEDADVPDEPLNTSPDSVKLEDVDIAQYSRFFQAVDFSMFLDRAGGVASGVASVAATPAAAGLSNIAAPSAAQSTTVPPTPQTPMPPPVPEELLFLFEDSTLGDLDRVWDVSHM